MYTLMRSWKFDKVQCSSFITHPFLKHRFWYNMVMLVASSFFTMEFYKGIIGKWPWKIVKLSLSVVEKSQTSTCPTCPYVFVYSIFYTRNSQSFYSSCSMRHSPWWADKLIFITGFTYNMVHSYGPQTYSVYSRIWKPGGFSMKSKSFT